LWQAIKKIKQITKSSPIKTTQGTWARSNQLEPPINRFKGAEIQAAINRLNPKKFPDCDLITSKILKELPTVGIKHLTQLFSAILLKGFFSAKWKVAQIILISKPV
jgi:hypothetical protein